MQNQLKENISEAIKETGWSMRKLEQKAGLNRNFISNFLRNKSNNPGIESIAKIANLLNVSIDELIGKEPEYKSFDLTIEHRDIFLETINHLSTTIQDRKNSSFKLDDFIDALREIYTFSLKKNAFNKEFADWFITSSQL